MQKKSEIILSILFVIFVFVFGILLIAMPDVSFSESENRILAQMPKATLKSVFDGSFEADFETYITDQFPFRDFWVKSNTVVSMSLLNKKDINGVYIADDGYLLEKFENIDQKRLENQITALTKFEGWTDVPVSLAIVPTSLSIYKEKLPAFAPAETETTDEVLSNQKDYIDRFYSSLPESVNTIDLYSVLEAHKDEYIYYRTDHHWTTLAALYAYEEICKEFGLESANISEFEQVDVSDSFYGTFYSKGNFPVEPDTITRFDYKEPVKYTLSSDGGEVKDTFYNEEYLSKKDKYAYFMSGNPAHMTVNTESETGKTLVLIKDSYTHCLLPFFVPHYDTIHMIDPRYVNQNLTDYVASLSPDQILIIYNAKTLSDDVNFIKLGYTPRNQVTE
ncbi:MAG: hypothetical protein J6B51_10270 [Clostridia bacterium]|nr:hypothetical protein [Clostridia bacterium]